MDGTALGSQAWLCDGLSGLKDHRPPPSVDGCQVGSSRSVHQGLTLVSLAETGVMWNGLRPKVATSWLNPSVLEPRLWGVSRPKPHFPFGDTVHRDCR